MSAGSAAAEAARGAGAAPAARLRGVRKRFGYRDVLRGVDLDVPRGGCFVLTGPNGAGKSTILRIIATQWAFTHGTVEVCGLDVRRRPIEVRSRIGLVFHEPFLRRELSLEENLRYSCDLRGLSWRSVRGRAEELLDTFGLLHRSRDPVRTFSQGMLKRASLARSLIPEPELWILDEPFSGLDPQGQELLERTVQDLASRGGTALLVTHRLEHARRLATRSARIEDGRVARQGPGASALAGAEPEVLAAEGPPP
ncbi:MAG: ABC transporter ATP-binding protein [Planctomycetes bacterium]|nr:ABC transporter ATP-binding protein [Planctomycetota bacterium]